MAFRLCSFFSFFLSPLIRLSELYLLVFSYQSFYNICMHIDTCSTYVFQFFFSNSFSFSLPFHMYGYRVLFILLALHSISLEPRDRRALRNALYNLSPYLSPNPYTQCRLIHVRNRYLLISRVLLLLLLPSPLSVTYCCSCADRQFLIERNVSSRWLYIYYCNNARSVVQFDPNARNWNDR